MVDDEKIKSKVQGEKVEITKEMISKVMLLLGKGLDNVLLDPTQPYVTQSCKNLVEEMVRLDKEGWLMTKMK